MLLANGGWAQYPQIALDYEGNLRESLMRIEATIPDSRGNAIRELANELGLTRSQLVDEAIALFLKAVLEMKRGRRLVALSADPTAPVCEVSTPTMTALEWTLSPQKLNLASDELTKVSQVIEASPPPSQRLREAVRRHRK